MLNEILKVVNTLVAVVIAAGGGFAVSKGLKAVASHTTNNNVKKALEFASQAVLVAQGLLGNGAVQQESAAYDLKKRLDENGIGKNFTEDQILSYIKSAYAKNKANGSLAAVKPIVSATDLAKAEEVVKAQVEKTDAPAAQ